MKGASSRRTPQESQIESTERSGVSNQSQPESVLMSRLAKGGRAEVSKKDMLKLTNKNYDNLPEVRKKREEEAKKEEKR